jgi:hypothetical protein
MNREIKIVLNTITALSAATTLVSCAHKGGFIQITSAEGTKYFCDPRGDKVGLLTANKSGSYVEGFSDTEGNVSYLVHDKGSAVSSLQIVPDAKTTAVVNGVKNKTVRIILPGRSHMGVIRYFRYYPNIAPAEDALRLQEKNDLQGAFAVCKNALSYGDYPAGSRRNDVDKIPDISAAIIALENEHPTVDTLEKAMDVVSSNERPLFAAPVPRRHKHL